MRVAIKPTFLPNKTEAVYYTDQNTNNSPYMLSRWKEGEYPVQTYDAKDWVGCLHGCALALTMLQDPQRTQNAIEDDGILHELIHILHFSGRSGGKSQLEEMKSVQQLRDDIFKLQEDAIGAYERIVKQSEDITAKEATARAERERQYNERRIGYSPLGERNQELFLSPFRPKSFYDVFRPFGPPAQLKDPQRAAEQFKAAAEAAKKEYSWEGKREGGNPIIFFHTGESVHQPVLPSAGEKEASDTPADSKAGGRFDVRTGDLREVPMYRLQQTRKVQPE